MTVEWENLKTRLQREGFSCTPFPPSSSRQAGPIVGTSGSIPVLSSRLSLPPPALYDGDPVDLDLFLFSMESYLVAGGVDLYTSFAVMRATLYLRGLAKQWWAGYVRAQADKGEPPLSDFSGFSAALSAYVRPLNGSRIAYAELLSLSQRGAHYARVCCCF